MEINLPNEKELDNEWVDLILKARNLGFSVEEIRDFLNNSIQTIKGLFFCSFIFIYCTISVKCNTKESISFFNWFSNDLIWSDIRRYLYICCSRNGCPLSYCIGLGSTRTQFLKSYYVLGSLMTKLPNKLYLISTLSLQGFNIRMI